MKKRDQLPRSRENQSQIEIYGQGKDSTLGNPEKDMLASQALDPLRYREVIDDGYYEGFMPSFKTKEIILDAFDNEKISSLGLTKIDTPSNSKNDPTNTPNDPRLGIMNRFDSDCQVCGGDANVCSGHYGYIQLDESVYFINPFFAKQAMLILDSVCHQCYRMFLRKEVMEELNIDKIPDKINRLKEIQRVSLSMQCTREPEEKIVPKFSNRRVQESVRSSIMEQCEQNPPVIYSDYNNYGEIFVKIGKDRKSTLKIETIKTIFNNIPREDLRLLGFPDNNRGPINYIVQNIMVIPPTIRKDTLHESELKTDKIADLYNNIIKANNEVRKIGSLSSKQKEFQDNRKKVQENYTKLVTQDKKLNYIDRTKYDYTGLMTELGQKTGIMRGRAGSKRTNFTARTVITPAGTSHAAHQIGIPMAFRTDLTPYTKVTRYNIEWLKAIILQGLAETLVIGRPKKYLKNNRYYEVPRGTIIRILKSNRQDVANTLAQGDTVGRYLMDGDYVLINRNPTIQKEGIMGAEVRLLPNEEKVIRLFLPDVNPFNADHDGDEMNIHLPQNSMVEAEMRNLMNVSNCVISAQNNSNEIKLSYTAPHSLNDLVRQDYVSDGEYSSALYLMAEVFHVWDYRDFKKRLNYYHVPERDGRAVFSLPIPANFSLGNKVRNGIYLEKSINGGQANALIHHIILFLDKQMGYSEDRAKRYGLDMMTYYQKFVDDAPSLTRTVGFQDCFVDDKRIEMLRQGAVNRARGEIAKLNLSTKDPLQKQLNLQRIMVTLSNTKNIGSKIPNEILDHRNNLVTFLETKSKGNTANLVQMIAGVFDIIVRGSFQKKNLFGNRPGPHFDYNDESLEALGFAEQSFSRGLPFEQIFFTISGGLEGLIDSANKTSETGDLARILNVISTAYKTEWDRSVRGTNGELLQFFYGGDGFDPRKLKKEKLRGIDTPFFTNAREIVDNLENQKITQKIEQKEQRLRSKIQSQLSTLTLED